MNEPIRLELTEEEWRALMVAVYTELRRGFAPKWYELHERILYKLRKASFEGEQNKIREKG